MSFFKQAIREISSKNSPLFTFEPNTSHHFSNEFCDKSISLINNCKLNKKGDYFSNGSDYRVFYINKDLSLETELNNTIKNILPKGWFIGPILGAHLKANKDSLGSGEGWHRDSWFGQKKIMIYLNDVDENNGPFQYLPNSSKFSNKFNSFIKGQGDRIDNESVDAKSIITVTGKRGTSCEFDGTMIHRGKPPISGERYALTVYLYSNSYNKNDIEAKFG